jgi:5,10-methylenetetrahydromethanopterin reductase
MTQLAPDLGAYILPGKVSSPKDGVTQAVEGERIGLGSIWASERWEAKETGAVLGAVSQMTKSVRLCTGTTHFVTRPPLVLAGMAATLQGLSDNRLILGFARSLDVRWTNMGLPIQTNALMADYVDILRRLWAGETVSYDGPAGHYPKMQMADLPEKAPPLALAAMGPKTLKLAGRVFDGVILHPFLTVEGVRRSVEVVHQAAVDAGRKPEDCRIYLGVVAAPDLTPEQSGYAVNGRAVSYLIHRMMSEWLVKYNGWDWGPIEALEKLGLEGLEMQQISPAEMQARMTEASKLVPREWIETGAATGTAKQCAEMLKAYRAAGADEIIIHGSTTDKLEALVKAYAAL